VGQRLFNTLNNSYDFLVNERPESINLVEPQVFNALFEPNQLVVSRTAVTTSITRRQPSRVDMRRLERMELTRMALYQPRARGDGMIPADQLVTRGYK
jgi:hypothetical protein